MTPPSSSTERLVERLASAQASRAAAPEAWRQKIRKTIVDPLVTAFGRLFAGALVLGGPRLVFLVHELLLRRINPPHLQTLAAGSAARREEIFRLLERFKRVQGKDCCFLILFSHPEGGTKMQLFSLALYHHVFKVGGLLYRSGLSKGYPRFFVAIDPFALDTMNWLSRSFYAGVAQTMHITLDRQPGRSGWLQRVLFLRKSAHTEAGFKFVNHLKAGHTVALAQAGGEPQNARLLYTAREFVAMLSKRGLRFDRALFLRQAEESRLVAEDKLSRIKRDCASWTDRELFLEVFVSLLTQDSLEAGVLSEKQRKSLRGLLPLAGIPEEETGELLRAFEREFKRETPYRERLFHILLQRILNPGIPLMLIPLRHDWEGETIHMGSPEILWQISRGRSERFYLDESGGLAQDPVDSISRYARDFTTRHFPL